MTIHIGAQPGEIAETVLLPGVHGVLARQPCHHSGIWHGHAEPVYLRQ